MAFPPGNLSILCAVKGCWTHMVASENEAVSYCPVHDQKLFGFPVHSTVSGVEKGTHFRVKERVVDQSLSDKTIRNHDQNHRMICLKPSLTIKKQNHSQSFFQAIIMTWLLSISAAATLDRSNGRIAMWTALLNGGATCTTNLFIKFPMIQNQNLDMNKYQPIPQCVHRS